jgi:RNA polymerase sigma-70 factor (ECF subfamily)
VAVGITDGQGGATPPEPDAMAPGRSSALHHAAVQALTGDPQSVDDLLRAVRALVLRYCRARLGSLPGADQAAEDAAQEVCVTVLGALPTYRETGRPFEAFVYTVASRRVADVMRASYRGPVCVEQVPDDVDAGPTPEAAVLRLADADRARDLLARLPETQRELLTLRVAVGMSAEEVGRALDMTPGAVRVAQHRALRRLRELVGQAR